MATVKNVQFGGGTLKEYYDKTGKKHDTYEAAKTADRAYDAQYGKSTGTMKAISKPSSSAGSTSSDATNDFLKKWGDMNDQTIAILNKSIEDMGAGNQAIQSLISDIGTQAKTYAEQYGGIEQASLDQTKADIEARGKLTNQFMDLSKADHEGVSGRAAADVRSASEGARGAEQREAMSYGINPGSGRFGSLTKKSYLDQARNEAIAMNTARRGEKERVAGMTERGLSLIDPSKSYAMASDISGRKADFVNQQAGLQTTAAGLSRSAADIAGGIANIGQQYGEAGMVLKGIEEGTAGTSTGSTAYSDTFGSKAPAQGMNMITNKNSSGLSTGQQNIKDAEDRRKTMGAIQR